ncbi:beta-lactamase domain-containing protein [Tritrichomonas foetus]|uniref:Beta-lactamase domain-containing protein n=1 Tax=Tritrichomonas foetus TaxID=1144522 RepID=A0A1J4JMT1_9EUKA|nr:beta-lactamase domain-containing protein [Tritrichomonas foetus]|eukprot:OHT00379.1 beta-lactamase domain-containing protein [Tritrichomonas foetus]
MTATLELLGTGMSHGVPVLGCQCETCTSDDPHDNRLRTSALLRGPETTVLIDCGADFRVQALRTHLLKFNAALITHIHADHIFGLDDLRVFSTKEPFPLFASEIAINDIVEHFDYIFKVTQVGGGKPNFDLQKIEGPFKIGEFTIVPIPLNHDYPNTLGYRIGNTAYLTDLSGMPISSYHLLHGVDQIVIDAVCLGKVKNHLGFREALDIIEKIKPKKAFFTHISHSMKHQKIQEFIDKMVNEREGLKGIEISPGYDGLVIDNVIYK